MVGTASALKKFVNATNKKPKGNEMLVISLQRIETDEAGYVVAGEIQTIGEWIDVEDSHWSDARSPKTPDEAIDALRCLYGGEVDGHGALVVKDEEDASVEWHYTAEEVA